VLIVQNLADESPFPPGAGLWGAKVSVPVFMIAQTDGIALVRGLLWQLLAGARYFNVMLVGVLVGAYTQSRSTANLSVIAHVCLSVMAHVCVPVCLSVMAHTCASWCACR
jgi:hypothetical protein